MEAIDRGVYSDFFPHVDMKEVVLSHRRKFDEAFLEKLAVMFFFRMHRECLLQGPRHESLNKSTYGEILSVFQLLAENSSGGKLRPAPALTDQEVKLFFKGGELHDILSRDSIYLYFD